MRAFEYRAWVSAYRGEIEKWSLPVTPARSVVVRRLVALLAGAVTFAAGAVIGLLVSSHIDNDRLAIPFMVGVIAAGLLVVRKLWFVPPSAMTERELRASSGGLLQVGDATVHLRSVRYDPEEELLWLRAAWGWPVFCARAEPATAWEIVTRLQVPELGVRTMRCPPGVSAVPWLGGPLFLGAGCAVMFATVMSIFGPFPFGLVVAAVIGPPAIAALRPARFTIEDDALCWRWYGWVRRIPFSEIEGLTAGYDAVNVVTRERRHRFQLVMRGGRFKGGEVERVMAQRVERYVDYAREVIAAWREGGSA